MPPWRGTAVAIAFVSVTARGNSSVRSPAKAQESHAFPLGFNWGGAAWQRAGRSRRQANSAPGPAGAVIDLDHTLRHGPV